MSAVAGRGRQPAPLMAAPRTLLVLLALLTAPLSNGTTTTTTTEPNEYEDPLVPIVDPEGCLRNRDEAAARGRQCLRKCASDADCISTRKRCLCDGLCGWSCIRPDLHCAELASLDNGEMKVTGDHFGARVMYTCKEGYWMSGPKERVCQGDGSWSEVSPDCRQKAMCGIPPQVPHARHNASERTLEFDVDDTVEYSCFQGYDPLGYPRAKCLFFNGTTQWHGLDLRCIPRSCEHPGDVENGRREGEVFTFTSRVTYHCDPGYELVGRANRYCQSKGEWSGPLPSCRPVQCPAPRDVPSGRVVYSSSTYQSVAKYECLHGYNLVGPPTRVCEANKQWDGEEPRCEEIRCESPGILHNGYVNGSHMRFGNVIYFTCLENMTFVGESATTTCMQDSTWSHPVPKCMAPCSLPTIHHGRITNYDPGSRVGHGKHIEVDCIAQYELRYNTTPATCNNGSWTHMPTCIPARCKTLPRRPRHGMVIAPKTDHGMKALFRCKDGYKLDGPNVTQCSFGRWMGDTPICSETYCPFPGLLENGRILLVGHMGMYDYRPYVRKITNNRQIMYECDRHYTLSEGPPGATCVDGRWSPVEKPSCVRGSHPQVRWERAARERRQARRKKHRRRRLDRRRKRKGGGSGGACPEVSPLPWMEVEWHGAEELEVRCGWGYQLNIGNRTARCVAGRWRPRTPRCVTTPCVVPDLPNGSLEGGGGAAGVHHGHALTVTCDPGFQLLGPDSLRCWYGEWAVYKMPKCIPGPCELPAVANGWYLEGYRPGLTISHGSSVRYSCEEGATPDPVQCLEGALKPHPPTCHTLQAHDNEQYAPHSAAGQQCTLPERLHRTLLRRGSTFVVPPHPLPPTPSATQRHFPNGTEVLFKCLSALANGKKTTWKIVCQDGVWVGRPHNCADPRTSDVSLHHNRSCLFRRPGPDVAAFFGDRRRLSEAELPAGAEVLFRCTDIGKFRFEGSARRRCIAGQWTGIEPACHGLSQEYDYALDRSPTVLFRTSSGQIAQSNDGKLIVYPNTVLHLECLWLRKYGDPVWEVSHNNRRYVQGWTSEPGRDSQLEYRLTIRQSNTEDSGLFTCVTPMGHRHAVEIHVAAIHCPSLPVGGGLEVSTQVTKMNVKVVFSCAPGRRLKGPEQATCLPSGRWSSKPPLCQKVPICPYPGASKGVTLSKVKFFYEVGETIAFGCRPGHKPLQGRPLLQCLDGGRWSGPTPQCLPAKKG